MRRAVLSSSFAQLSLYTDDPDAASVLAEARHAAAAGMLRPVKSLGSIYRPGSAEHGAAGRGPAAS